MRGLGKLLSAFGGKKVDIAEVKQKLQTPDSKELLTDTEIMAYIDHIKSQLDAIVKDLKQIYSNYDIIFTGFKSLTDACVSLKLSVKSGTEAAYNNLIKIENDVTIEQKRHLALIRMAVTKDGGRVIEQIYKDKLQKERFDNIFGVRGANNSENSDGMYQRLWSEIHHLSEYILLHKNKVYH